MAQVNYSAEMTAKIISDYQNSMVLILPSVEKSVRSVRSKLVREGVYVAKPKAATKSVQGPTKKELLNDLEATGFDVQGFEGATKDAIARLIAHFGN